MLKTFSAFLALFWALCLLVQEARLASLFACAALVLFAADLIVARHERGRKTSSVRELIT